MRRFIDKVFHADALDLLRLIPAVSVDAVITDGMFGTAKNCQYDWGPDPAKGDPVLHWHYHQPIYQECLRVLKPGGVLAWAQGVQFYQQFPSWFGKFGVWTPIRISRRQKQVSGHLWVVQSKEQQPFPDNGGLIVYDSLPRGWGHPCPKPFACIFLTGLPAGKQTHPSRQAWPGRVCAFSQRLVSDDRRQSPPGSRYSHEDCRHDLLVVAPR
jgi:hypothetical protein